MSDEAKLALGVAAAFVTALASLVVAILNGRATRKLEREKADRGELAAERSARREYEYKARLRLYEEYEPLLFQLVEASENALHRIQSLARSARRGDIRRNGSGWLGSDEYYLTSTLYTILAPLAVFRLMRRKLTLVDLSVDPLLARQYEVAKQLYAMLSEDFEFAALREALPYEPFVPNWPTARQADPQRHWRQGVAIRRVDNGADALIISDAEGRERLMSFGQFDDLYGDPASEVHERVGVMADIFQGFHPVTRPVLWRILIAKAHVYESLLSIRDRSGREGSGIDAPWEAIAEDSRARFDWRADKAEASDADVLVVPFDAACDYLRQHLGAGRPKPTSAL